MLSVLGLWTLSFNDARIAGQKLSDWCFVAAAGALTVNLLTGRTRRLAPVDMRRTPPMVLVGTLLLMTGGALSSLWSVNPLASMLEVTRYGSVTLLWFWLLRAMTEDRETLWQFIRAFKATVLLSCFGGLLGFLHVLAMNGDPAGPNANRQSAWFDHPNLLAFLLAIGLPLFFLDVATKPTTEGRRLVRRWVPTGIVVFFLSSTGSMTGAVAAVAGLAVIAIAGQLSRGRERRGAAMRPLALLAGFVVAPIAMVALISSSAPLFERLQLFRAGEANISSSVDSRGEFNDYALSQLGNRLVTGIGLDEDSHLIFPPPDSAAANHNMYLTVLLDAGLPALLGLAVILFWAIKSAWRMVRQIQDPELYPVALALLAMSITAMIAAFFHPIQHFRVYWFPVALISVVWALRRHELMVERNAQLARAGPRRIGAARNGSSPSPSPAPGGNGESEAERTGR